MSTFTNDSPTSSQIGGVHTRASRSSTLPPKGRGLITAARRALLATPLWLLFLASACATPSDASVSAAVAPDPEPISLEGWPSESFVLPPGFAPDLPAGNESLRFAPGWRDPSSADFWSYTIAMWIDEPAPDASRIDDILELYYDGLMVRFAAGQDKDVGSDPAQVEVTTTAPNHFEAQMHLIDCFATFEPIDLRVLVDTVTETLSAGHERTVVRIQLSPQPKEHRIWRSLEAANATMQEP
ncbi:MAG: hypothetical protein ACI9EF_000180 [Pseudohongiellaceae bacterium]|jgi:hypothetical protein